MRNGQNKRMRGRNRKGGHHHHQNPLSRMYESNGPDIKIRGTASHVAEKYLQLARDAQSSGDPVAAENYYQHAEHYFRLIAAAQEQFRQSQPYGYQQGAISAATSAMTATTMAMNSRRRRAIRTARAATVLSSRATLAIPAAALSAAPPAAGPNERGGCRTAAIVHHRRRPAATTTAAAAASPGPQWRQRSASGPNGQNGYDGSADRFPLHRRRRRHRGPRDHSMPGEGDAPSGPRSNDD